MRRSILPPEMQGVVKATGYRGKGKTSFLIQADDPDLIAFLDFEHKGRGFHNQLNFGFYKDMVAGASGPSELYDVILSTISELEQDRYTVAILDNCSPLELALRAGARRDTVGYCEEYGLNIKNVRRGSFGGLKSVVNYLISDKICNTLHGKGIQMIGITHHIGAKWGAGGQIPNKKRIKGADRWMELAILSVVIVNKGDFSPVPSAMVEKEQLSTISYDREKGQHYQQRRLPARLPKCTFRAIKHYLKHPADLDNPAPGEAIIEAEYKVFSDKLDSEQLAIMRLALEQRKREAEGPEPEPLRRPGCTAEAKQLKAKGKMSTPAIARETGLSIKEVVNL